MRREAGGVHAAILPVLRSASGFNGRSIAERINLTPGATYDQSRRRYERSLAVKCLPSMRGKGHTGVEKFVRLLAFRGFWRLQRGSPAAWPLPLHE
jgi:hypothetical protein